MHNTQSSSFKKYLQSVKTKVKRLIFCILTYVPFMGIVWIGAWYLKRQLPGYINEYFNVSGAQKWAQLTQSRVDFLKETLSFPIGLPNYMAAWSANIAAASKAATLEMAAKMALSLVNGLLHVAVILLILYCILRIIKRYKLKTRDDVLVNQIMNKLTPLLEEINQNMNDLKKDH